MGPIKTWSFSRLQTFEKCAQQAYLRYVEKIPEPEQELPPGKTEHPLDRGSRIHEAAELFVRGGVELIEELESFRTEFEALREHFKAGRVTLEEDWGIDVNWDATSWRSSNIWGRFKLDAMVWLSKHHAVVIDYKTGKKFGNEVKHMEQGQLYQLAAFMRYPDLVEVDVEFWYTDQNELTHTHFTQAQGFALHKKFDDRAHAMTDAVNFPPRPSLFICKWCPFGPAGTGHCKVGVQIT